MKFLILALVLVCGSAKADPGPTAPTNVNCKDVAARAREAAQPTVAPQTPVAPDSSGSVTTGQ